MYSILPCPKGCSASGFFPEILNPKIVTTEAAASERLLKASATTETEFAISPAKSLKENKKRLKQIPVIPQRIPY